MVSTRGAALSQAFMAARYKVLSSMPMLTSSRIFGVWNSLSVSVSAVSMLCWWFFSDQYSAAHLRCHSAVPIFKLGICVYALVQPRLFWQTWGGLFAIFCVFQVLPSLVSGLYGLHHAHFWLPSDSTYQPILPQRLAGKGKQRASSTEPDGGGRLARLFHAQAALTGQLLQDWPRPELSAETESEQLMERLRAAENSWTSDRDFTSSSLVVGSLAKDWVI